MSRTSSGLTNPIHQPSAGGDLIRSSPKAVIGFLLTAGSLIGFAAATTHGIGVWPDSLRYFRIHTEMPYDAPLYTWVLDTFRVGGISVVAGAWILALALVCVNACIIWLLLSSTSRLLPSLIGSALVLASPIFVEMHTLAMSEPLFIALFLATAVIVCAFLRSGSSYLLILAGFGLGLCMLARFSAAPLALAIATSLLLDRSVAIGRRVLNIATIAAVSGALFLAWVAASLLTRGQALGRDLSFIGNPDAERWLLGLNSLTTMLLPTPIPFVVRLVVLAVLLGASAMAIGSYSRRVMKESAAGCRLGLEWLPIILGLFAAFYVPFMLLSVLIEANLPINGRYLLPVYVAVVIATTISLGGERASVNLRSLGGTALAGLAVVILGSHVVRSAEHVRQGYEEGVGFDGTRWHISPIVNFVKTLPAESAIYSNAPDALAYLTGRSIRFVPSEFDRRTGQENPARPLERQLSELRDAMAQRSTYVVFVDGVDWRFYLLREERLQVMVPLRLAKTLPDGRVYVGGGKFAPIAN